ncbi:TonB-dependent receptor [Panacibacter sp. DH6]|uniref:TonB-dependent receptor n=1 Tax=Panacibacter microcysteis TaxID=2793269 RepID=A0A931H0A5_9BACT|nr:TonB-dependent receptor [Panacibacter microcysteis]MBG9378659.1 TonB-dependent receptor [Panacibacter microcysteis]
MKLLLRRTLVLPVRFAAMCSPLLFCLFFAAGAAAQDTANTASTDTATLNAVTVKAFSAGLKWKDVPASVAILNKTQLAKFDGTSLVPIINSVTGVRMEERSPGSYRLSVRGSLLRSPFGVRNIKIYMDDLPLTDATGNTYLNLIDLNQLQSVEIIKGPSSSFYGANTGGAVILNTDDKRGIEAGLSGGSFGLFKEYVSVKEHTDKLSFGLQQSHTQSDGYRQQSALRRDVVQGKLGWKVNKFSSLTFLGLYANLHYETPGGITKAQMDSLPRLARLPAGSTPGAIQQNAGIYNATYLGAVTYNAAFTERFSNTTLIVFSYTNFNNPFITNYERRREQNYGARTNFQYVFADKKDFSLKANVGAEAQYNHSYIQVFDNNGGETADNQFRDKVHTTQYFLFGQLSLKAKNWLLQAGASTNSLRYWYNRLTDSVNLYPIIRKTGNTVSPRLGLSYAVDQSLSFYVTAAKGFSPPTLAEVLPSGGTFTQTLQAEYGWNYEAGLKGSLFNNHLQYNGSVYYFALKNAIVRRVDADGNEFFVNAGGTVQKGMELWLNGNVVNRDKGFVRSLGVWNSFSYQPYKFDDYKSGEDDFSGNSLTGVPRYINVSGIDARFAGGVSLNAMFNYTSSIQLDDANTAEAKAYHLLQVKIAKLIRFNKFRLNIFAGADNLLNEVYSLGNDINAFGGRFYNPAPARNYYGGIAVKL